MVDTQTAEALEAQLDDLERGMGGAAALAGAFGAELARMREAMAWTGKEVAALSTSIGGGLRRAFDGLVFDGLRASDALRLVGRSIADSVYSAAMKPVQDAMGDMVAEGIGRFSAGVMPFAAGAGFAGGRVTPFAGGGVVDGPTFFPLRGGAGLMGEAGPEAILPLARGADGRLGVRGGSGGRVNVTFNITTPDAESFRRSRGQIAAEMGRALARGQRNR